MSVMDMFSLKGKNALIIGGSKGLGEGMARAITEAGAVCVVSSRNQEVCDKAAEGIMKDTGGMCYGIAADVSTKEGVDKLVNTVIEKLGHIDILINSAGVNVRCATVDYKVEDWDYVMDVQLKAVFMVCQAVGKHMIENGIKGKIINLASTNSKVVVRPNIVAYVSAKGAIMQLTKALAVEWAPYGICVNSIAPGMFETDLTRVTCQDPVISKELLDHTPIRRFGEPSKDLSGIAVYFASDASNYTTGQIIYVDGGYTLV